VILPETRNANAGLRFQGAVSRFLVNGDVRYSRGEILAREQRRIFTSIGVDMRIDPANAMRVQAARSFSLLKPDSLFTLTFTYTHRFGEGSEGGFQFGHLLGLDRAQIEGHVFSDINGNGQGDADEPGVSGVTVQLDEKTIVFTDEQGHFRFRSVTPGNHTVSLLSKDLGVRFRASTASEETVFLESRQTTRVDFGITNSGFVSGHVFNDLLLTGKQDALDLPGVAGVRLILRSAEAGRTQPAFQIVDSSGQYQYHNLAPGSYLLELDLESLPSDFHPPAQTTWPIKVEALRGSYFDIPLAAQRAISGIVFIDNDGDGEFNPQKDEPVVGARVSAGGVEGITGPTGAYILRKLPAGRLVIVGHTALNRQSRAISLDLGAEPAMKRGVNLALL
jgi:hypothetical protein